MKTNKIIFISFFSLVALSLLSILILGFAYNSIAIKENMEKRNNIEKRTNIYKIEKQFNHIFVKNGGSIKIAGGEEQLVKSYSYNSKDSMIAPTCEILNDTLFISLRKEISATLELNNLENLISINSTNTTVQLSSLNMSSLKLNFTSGNIRIDKGVNISNLYINLYANSKFTSNHLNIDSLYMNINSSQFHGRYIKKLANVKGAITNKSNVQLPKALHIDLDIDKSSKVSM